MRAILPSPGMAIKPVQIEFQLTKPVSEEKMKEVIKWCDAMKQKYPHMKAQRIANKAIKYFNL